MEHKARHEAQSSTAVPTDLDTPVPGADASADATIPAAPEGSSQGADDATAEASLGTASAQEAAPASAGAATAAPPADEPAAAADSALDAEARAEEATPSGVADDEATADESAPEQDRKEAPEVESSPLALAVLRFRTCLKNARKNPSRGRIHDLRTAGRQLEPLLSMLHEHISEVSEKDAFRVGRYIRRFSKLRALDVADRLVKSLADDPESGLSPADPALQDVRRCLKKARAQQRGELWRFLKNPPKGLKGQIRFLLQQDFDNRAWTAGLVLFAQGLHRELVDALRTLESPDQEETALHRVRLLGKGLRYTLELIPELSVPEIQSALAESQKRLGLFRDWAGLEDFVTERRQQVLGKRKKASLRPALAGLEAVVRTRVERAQQAIAPALQNLLQALEPSWAPVEAPADTHGADTHGADIHGADTLPSSPASVAPSDALPEPAEAQSPAPVDDQTTPEGLTPVQTPAPETLTVLAAEATTDSSH